MARFKNLNGQQVPLSPEEETARDAEEAAWAAGEVARIRERVFSQAVEAANSQFSIEERLTLLALYIEVELYKLAALVGQQAAVETPGITAIKTQVFPGQTKAQIATTIENRVKSAIETSAVALANKIKDGG